MDRDVDKQARLFKVSKSFWATICKTVHPMLSVHCLSVLSVLSVTLVYCDQTVGWIKMKLGMPPIHA